MSIVKVSSLDWPEGPSPKLTIECAGEAFVDLCLRQKAKRVLHHGSSFFGCSGELVEDESAPLPGAKKPLNLLALTHRKLEKLTYYQCLGDLPLHSTPDQIKRAYHKACLKYHPDKTGRGEDDEVFLKVKAAFDTLSEPHKKKAYDSTMDFDESIPKGGETPEEFYKLYGPVFERNLRFDIRLDPTKQVDVAKENGAPATPSAGKSKKKGGKKGKGKQPAAPKEFPLFGDDDTPLDQVHAFYEYWIHFESWRDFSLQAAKTSGEHFDPDSADSRYEKRFMQKEIEKKAKKLKTEEMARLNLLVERAMANDPRLKRVKQKEKDDKERIAKEKKDKEESAARAILEEQVRLQVEAAKKEQEDKLNKANAKQQKEAEKKVLRKAKQTFRKLTMAAWQLAPSEAFTMDTLNDQVEFLCENLMALELDDLSKAFGGLEAIDNPNVAGLERISGRVADVKEGRLDTERKEREAAPATTNGTAAVVQEDVWTDEQDKALQEALKKYPATMDKNERWDSIAKDVEGKSKKECVNRFSAIRDAIQAKKTNGAH
jgi:DnaJ homolog subfamily C member 2